jgi:polar amino acid transport system substrate-binding protein
MGIWRSLYHQVLHQVLKASTSIACGLVLLGSTCAPVWADSVLEQVRETGVLTAGTSTDAVPFAYIDDNGEWVGYSLVMLERIRAALEAELGQPIRLELLEVSAQDWLPRVASGELHLVCSSTSYTFNRSLDVGFSVPYFTTGTQLLVRRDMSDRSHNLRIGVIPNTTNEGLIKLHLPFAEFVPVDNRIAGFSALQSGHIHALASDGILLEGLRRRSDNPETLTLMPSEPYDNEMYGCLLPLEDEPFEQVVNRSLLEFMEQVLGNQTEAIAIFDTWFGVGGVVPVNQEYLRRFFQQRLQEHSAPLEQALD